LAFFHLVQSQIEREKRRRKVSTHPPKIARFAESPSSGPVVIDEDERNIVERVRGFIRLFMISGENP